MTDVNLAIKPFYGYQYIDNEQTQYFDQSNISFRNFQTSSAPFCSRGITLPMTNQRPEDNRVV